MIDLVITDDISKLIQLVPNLDNKIFKFGKISKDEAKYFVNSATDCGTIFSYTTLMQNEDIAKCASEDLRFDIVCDKNDSVLETDPITPYKKVILYITKEKSKIIYYLVEVFDATDM